MPFVHVELIKFSHFLNSLMFLKRYYIVTKLYLFYIRALISLYQINSDKCTHNHFIKTIRYSNLFQPLKGHLQGVYLIHSRFMYQIDSL